MTYYFILDTRQMSKDDFLRLEQVISIEATKLKWKLFAGMESQNIGEFFISLN